MKSGFRKFRAAVAALLALVAPTIATAKAPSAARPALWAVSDADTTIYLFGTIHLLPRDLQWHSKAVDDAVAGSDQLVVETIIDEKDPSKMMAAMSSLAFTQGLPPLVQRVPEAKRDALRAAMKKSGYPEKALDGMETWAAAFLLLAGQFGDLSIEQSAGVETVLRRDFSDKGKSIGELESNVEQLGYFDRLSEASQRTLLEGAIEQSAAVKAQFQSMLDAWSSGNVDSIAQAFNRDLADTPELRDFLLTQRNQAWSRWIARRLDQPGTVFVAVGAGHLAGADSVIAQLEEGGVKARRLQ